MTTYDEQDMFTFGADDLRELYARLGTPRVVDTRFVLNHSDVTQSADLYHFRAMQVAHPNDEQIYLLVRGSDGYRLFVDEDTVYARDPEAGNVADDLFAYLSREVRLLLLNAKWTHTTVGKSQTEVWFPPLP
jgi:hypothetical protein